MQVHGMSILDAAARAQGALAKSMAASVSLQCLCFVVLILS